MKTLQNDTKKKERNDTYKVYDKNRFEKIIRLSRVNKIKIGIK